jgi:hypothetical protein
MTSALTGYAVAKVANEMLAQRGLKTIPPQMIYNYIAKGYIEKNDEGLVELDTAAAWAEAYVAKKAAKATA